MENQKHIVIFSHGFGVQKDSSGLFTEISEYLSSLGVNSILFDYNIIDHEKKEVTVRSFSEQTKILQSIINQTIKDNPKAIIDVIGHSQGAVMVANASLKGIRKVLIIAPFFHTDIKKVMERYTKFPNSEFNLTGISRRTRSDGTTTVIPSEYWSERFNTDIYNIYNKLALLSDLTIIRAGEDQIMKEPNLLNIFNAFIISVHGDHDFRKEYRKSLLEVIKKILK